ncbi:hypothetical protein [Streptomyces sp. NPDC004284]|uniref:hypothetical protein n=1 Tax=Streptomyces sp. NPDC004284 TaxID=3364695 RepID=UPI0036767690
MSSPSHASAFRRRRWRLSSVATTVPLLASGLAVLQAPAQATPSKPTVPAKPSATHKVTLVTGDVVTVTTTTDGKQIADVDRPDSAVGGVKLQEIKGDLYAIPDEAAPLLGTDKLDRRLFNVTDLIEMGYDDAKSAAVPLVATYTQPKSRAAVEPAAPRGSKLTRRPQGIGGAALSTEKRQAHTFWNTVAPQGGTRCGRGCGEAVARRAREGQSEGERAADRRARGVGGGLHREGRQGRGARHRHRRQPPRFRRTDRRHGELRAG